MINILKIIIITICFILVGGSLGGSIYLLVNGNTPYGKKHRYYGIGGALLFLSVILLFCTCLFVKDKYYD